ncbi:MAG TPA: AraC family transcriptional regulator [Daejeonella sp.]|uniref:AraC family transcriptional regulator n=1 Tax=Daejeonella sp. TaxID=2805397 RepID=UPI002ED9FC8C
MKSDIPVYDISSFSEFRHEDILVARLSEYWETHKDLYYSHRHNFYHIVLFKEGKGTHSIDFQTFPVKANQMYFMIPGQVHNWNFEGAVEGYVINFSISFFQSFLLKPEILDDFIFFSGVASDSVIQVPDELESKVRSIFDEILDESLGNRLSGLTLVRALLMQIFILVSRLNSFPHHEIVTSRNHTLLKNFKVLIEKNYADLKLPKEYAELLFITPNHLNALCNHLLGKSAGELIRDRLFLEAKRLLMNPDLTISEVSGHLNFVDNSYFSRAFKKSAGISPEEFRKRSLNNQYESEMLEISIKHKEQC